MIGGKKFFKKKNKNKKDKNFFFQKLLRHTYQYHTILQTLLWILSFVV